MKRLILFLCIIVNLQLCNVFAQEVDPKQIEEMSAEVKAKKNDLTKKQQELEQQITKQQEIVDQAPPEQKKEESDKLQSLKIVNSQAKMTIISLSDYLDQVDKKNVTQEYQAAAKDDIDKADNVIKIINTLKAEYLPSAPTQEETGQEAQAQIEESSWWNAFKLNVQSVFAQTKAALASFFGNKEAAAAAHEDLINIYDQLEDYGSKAQNAGKLAELYKDLGKYGDALKAQSRQLDAVANLDMGQIYEKVSVASVIVADLLSLRSRFDAGELELNPQDSEIMQNIMQNVEKKIDDFLGDLGFGYKVDKVSGEIIPMSSEEKAAFDARKKEEAAQKKEKAAQEQRNIMGNG